MVTAWSFAEIIRYVHYATGLMGMKIKALEWLRCVYLLSPRFFLSSENDSTDV